MASPPLPPPPTASFLLPPKMLERENPPPSSFAFSFKATKRPRPAADDDEGVSGIAGATVVVVVASGLLPNLRPVEGAKAWVWRVDSQRAADSKVAARNSFIVWEARRENSSVLVARQQKKIVDCGTQKLLCSHDGFRKRQSSRAICGEKGENRICSNTRSHRRSCFAVARRSPTGQEVSFGSRERRRLVERKQVSETELVRDGYTRKCTSCNGTQN